MRPKLRYKYIVIHIHSKHILILTISLDNSEMKTFISVSKVINLFENEIILRLKTSAEVERLKISIRFYQTNFLH